MTTLKLKEYIDVELLTEISRHKEVYEPDRDGLQAFLQSVNADGEVDITYKQRLTDGVGFGRLYPEPYRLSAIYQWSRIRATLYGATETDIDIVNAQPSILLGYCQQYGMDSSDYQSLTEWVNNRDEIIATFAIEQSAIDRHNEAMKDNKTAKDLVKKLVVMTSFGSNLSQWKLAFGLSNQDVKIPRWYKMYEMESHAIAKYVVDNHPKKHIAVEMWKNKDRKKSYKKNQPPTEDKDICHKKVLALILQDKEAEIVLNAITILRRHDIQATSYIYDGFQVKNTELLTDNMLKLIENPEFNCKFIRKPFNDALDLSPENLIPKPMDYFNPAIMNAIGRATTESTTEVSLQEKKLYFEKYYAILTGSSKVLEQNGDKLFYHTPSNLRFQFTHCKIKIPAEKGTNEILFINWWLEQEDRKTYCSVERLPPPLSVPDNVLNLWTGWEIEKYPLDKTANFDQILELFKIVTNRCDKSYEYLLNWYAHKIQKPAQKTQVCLVFYSAEEGTGKTIAEDIFTKFMGKQASSMLLSTTSMDDICGKFASAGDKLITVLNEANLTDVIGKANPFKSFITDTTFFKEIKGVMGEMTANICDCIATTNNKNAMKVGANDRRFAIFEADATVANNQEVFKPIYKSLNNKDVMRHFFEFLNTRDISAFHPSRDRVKTDIYKEFQSASLSSIQLFFCELSDENTETEDYWASSSEIYEKYCAYCLANNKHNNRVTKDKFMKSLKKDVFGITRTKKSGVRGIEINILRLKEWVHDMRGSIDDDDMIVLEPMDSEEECEDI